MSSKQHRAQAQETVMAGEAGEAGEAGDVLAHLLKRAAGRLITASDAALQPVGITSRDLGALRVVASRRAASQLAVAEALGVDRTTMVALLDALEHRGLLARRPDPRDRRRNTVELTKAGARVLQAAEAAYRGAERAFLADLDEGATEQLRRTLRRLLS